jgi:hypothetical protein
MWRQGAWRAKRLLLEQLTLAEGAGERIVSHSAASSSSTSSLLLLPARALHASAPRLAVLPGTKAHGALLQHLRLAADSGASLLGARWQVRLCGGMAIDR